MTEEEAKTKWCPMVRWEAETLATRRAFNNREQILEGKCGENSRCIASECMMWRPLYREVTKADEEACDLYRAGDKNMPDGGYCGLAK